eukprot:15263091-Alexandrium_andersonii.AAC.1
MCGTTTTTVLPRTLLATTAVRSVREPFGCHERNQCVAAIATGVYRPSALRVCRSCQPSMMLPDTSVNGAE